jgi:adenylate cyclase
MEHYYKRDFARARTLFDEVRQILPRDYASELMAERCARYQKDPPPANWDGAEVMTEK